MMNRDPRSIAAIPTMYEGVMFRSRLEARWAAFFDLCKWNWDYEAEDLKGWIPDFRLNFYQPVYVEIKPASNLQELYSFTKKIQAAQPEKEVLLLGSFNAQLLEYDWLPRIGLLSERIEQWIGDESFPISPPFEYDWAPAPLYLCSSCHKPSFSSGTYSFHCRVSGCYDGDAHWSDWPDRTYVWRNSGNLVQWWPD